MVQIDKFNELWPLDTWRRGTGPPTLPRTWRLQPAVGWRRLSNFGAFFAFITARQGGRGQEQEGGTGEEGGQEGVQPRGVYWTCP